MKTARILLADDHELIRDGIRARLASHPDWEICGEAGDGREAVELARELQPDVAIVDIGMAGMNGITATGEIRRACPDTSVLILTVQESEEQIRAALMAGARGFLLKSDTGRLLATALEALLAGKSYFTGLVADLVVAEFVSGEEAPPRVAAARPTPREREIIQLLGEGNTSKEAARCLGVSVRTVEAHRANIMRKLKLRSVADLVRYAVRNGIVQA